MKIKHLGVLLGLLHAIYAVPSILHTTMHYMALNAILFQGYNLESESYIQEEGEPSKEYKEEVQKYLQENNNGVQMAFREEQVKNEGDSGKLQEKICNWIANRVLPIISRELHSGRRRTK